MNGQTKVSVCTPVYNGGKFLARCIDGVLGQTFKNFEYVIVDNASTDDTPDIIERYRKLDSRIRVIKNEKTVPVIDNFNMCWKNIQSDTEWIKYALADDYLFPHCIEDMLKLGLLDEQVGLVSAYRIYDARLASQGLPREQNIFPGAEVLKRQLMREIHVCTGAPNSVMYRRSVFDELGGFDNTYLHADTRLALQILNRYKLAFEHQVLSWTGHHADRVEVRSIKQGLNIREYLDFGFKKLDEYTSVSFSDTEKKKLAGFYAKQVFDFRMKKLISFDYKTYKKTNKWVPQELSISTPAILYDKLSVFTKRIGRAAHRRLKVFQ